MHRCPVLCSQNQRQAKLVCYGVARVAVKYGTKDDENLPHVASEKYNYSTKLLVLLNNV